MASRTINGLALCAGVGGLELGIELAVPGYRVVCGVEHEAYPAAALVARMEAAAVAEAPIWDDVHTFDGRPWRGIVDVISAGFPCQPISKAGSKQGTEDNRWIWPDLQRIIREVQPRWVFLENVPQLVRHGLGSVLGGLAGVGYDAEWDLFSAASVGAPHQRTRLFILATRRVDVAHAGRELCEGWDDNGAHQPEGEEEVRSGRATVRRLFPPPPAAFDLWRGVLAVAPTLEPTLCRVADGVAGWLDDRPDRLRACGNGVVPLAAAYALRTLYARYEKGMVR